MFYKDTKEAHKKTKREKKTSAMANEWRSHPARRRGVDRRNYYYGQFSNFMFVFAA